MIHDDYNSSEHRLGRSMNEIIYGTLNNPCAPPATTDHWQKETVRQDWDTTINYPVDSAKLAQANFDGTWLDNRLHWRKRVQLFATYVVSAIGLFFVVTAALNFIAKY